MAIGRVVALARALGWTLAEMQRATGVDLGIAEASTVGEGSADVYPLSAALNPEKPGGAIDHEAVVPGVEQPLLLRADTDEMHGTTPASIRPGDYLHVDRAHTTLEEGRVYVVTDADGPHVRLYTTTRLGAVFRAENRQYEDIPAQEAQVVGLVAGVTSDYNPQLLN
ncbi:S24 family peptidase [Deinococcus sp. NW-56]|nr:S24 family peptidase [Deinococcus sp. NW-56]